MISIYVNETILKTALIIYYGNNQIPTKDPANPNIVHDLLCKRERVILTKPH